MDMHGNDFVNKRQQDVKKAKEPKRVCLTFQPALTKQWKS